MKRSFTLDEIGKDLPYHGAVENKEFDTGRWGTYKQCIFKHDDSYWSFDWFEGATEYQDDEYPWGYDESESFECVQVYPVEKQIVVIEWMEI